MLVTTGDDERKPLCGAGGDFERTILCGAGGDLGLEFTAEALGDCDRAFLYELSVHDREVDNLAAGAAWTNLLSFPLFDSPNEKLLWFNEND